MNGPSKPLASRSDWRPSPDELDLLNQVIRAVARGQRLTTDDAQEFGQAVHLKLLERHYDVFERHSGLSTLKTFLTVVIRRLFIDWQRARHGKWRRSSRAARLGPYAVALDRLMSRDGYALEHALQVVRRMEGAPNESALRAMADELPPHPWRRLTSDGLDDLPGRAFEDPVEEAQRIREKRRVRRLLAEALQELSPQDRWLLTARYRQQQKVCAIARSINADPAKVYRRCDRVLRSLRATLASAGVKASGEAVQER